MLLALLIALSGWEGKVHFTHDPPRKSGGSDGAIHVAGTRVRIEEPSPVGPMVILSSGGRVRMLFPEKKQAFEVAPRDAPLATVPPLSTDGMQAAGEEVIDGQNCVIWQRTIDTPMGRVRESLWVPAAKKKLFFFLRWVTRTPRGGTRADVSELRVAAQPGSLFRVPPGYARK